MFTEEIARDLSVKTNMTEKDGNKDMEETKSDEQISENDVEMVDNTDTNRDSIDLSVRKRPDDEPVSDTLDLSVTNSKPSPDPEPEPMQIDSNIAPEKEILNNSVNHINGFKASLELDEKEADDQNFALLPLKNEIGEEELKAKQKRMRRLKQELRNEEMKLVLLKKLRQSQLMKENIVTPVSNQNNHSAPIIHSASKMLNNMSSRNGSMPPSVASQNSSAGHNRTTNHGIKSHSVLNPPIGRNHQSHGPICPPPLGLGQRSNSNHMPSAAHSSSLRPNPLSSMNRTPVTTPPNVVLGYPIQDIRNQTSSNNSLLSSHQSLGLGNTSSPGPNSAEATQTPAQRQAAAKLALRKQLEKTLLQIPPPKPPPPEMHFIPNANNQEFVYYLGLETVVDFLTDSPNQNRPPPDPFECVQCGTDFTPVWKWQDRIDPKSDRPAVICETCVTSNIKKALKAEHTNRLKTAFVKALQQEQEIEQRIASGATSPPLPSISPPPQQTNYNGSHQSMSNSSSLVSSSQSHLPQAPPAHSSMPRLSGSAANAAAAAAAVASSAALLQQMPKLSAAHQSLFAAQAQQLHQLAQSLPQPQPAHMLPFAPLLAAQAYSYSMLGKSGVPSNDLHRQYLLDMIPSRSLPQSGSMNWKT